MSPEIESLLVQAAQRKKWPLARLISLFENNNEQSRRQRHAVMAHIQNNPEHFSKHGLVLGITGTPGAGKSSLIGKLCLNLLEKNPELSVAVLAIDPSSQDSGGSLLGDRTRVRFASQDDRLFFRSQASDLDLGGVGRKTYQVIRLLRKLFDVIVIETVGIGQSEVEIEQLSDHACLVLQPFAGDQVQFMKAGIMEVPDAFIINKCDEDALAKKSYHLLRASLKLISRHVDEQLAEDKKIFLTSAVKNIGLDALTEHVITLQKDRQARKNIQRQEQFYLQKTVRNLLGDYGIAVYQQHQRQIDDLSTYDEKELAMTDILRSFVTDKQLLPI